MTAAAAASGRARGYATGLMAAAILASTSVVIRHLNLAYGLPALVMAFWRDLMVVATLVPVFAIWRRHLLRLPHGLLPFLVLHGLVLAVFNLLWTLSVTINGAAAATVLVYCSAAFSVFLGRWLLGEPLGPAKLAATALCLGGCVLVSGACHSEAWRANPVGIVAGVLSGLSYAAYSLMGRAAAGRGANPWTTLWYIFAFATGFLFLFNLPPGGLLPGVATRPADLLWLGRSVPGWGELFLLSAGPTLVGFGLYMVTLTYLPSGVANLVVSLEPAFTALYAFLFLGERLGAAQTGGGLLILSGVALLRLQEIWRPQAA